MITRFTHRLWRRVARAALLPVALGLALLPSVTPAHAQAQRTALAGVETETFNYDTVSRLWGAGPWAIGQNLTLSGTFDYGVLHGTVTDVVSTRLTFPSGDGQVWGTRTYTASNGVVCSGQASGKTTGFLLSEHIVAPCSDGSLLQGTLQTVSNDFDVVVSTFQGELLSP
jgi:hypothetical protein